MSTETPTSTTADAVEMELPPRRGPGGRLYHGETAIDFYGRKWWGLGLSILLIVITLGSLAFRGLNLGIDFEGGVSWEVPSAQLTTADARAVLDAQGINSTNAKITTLSSTSGEKSLLIQVEDQPLEKQQSVREALATAAKVTEQDVSSNSVSSTWGSSITEKAIRALVIFLALVALFIAWRFEWRMALGAIAAMLHDVLISVGVYSVLGFEVTPATVVAFLTILGFSLYDTIVVFDKVKDNDARYSGTRAPYADVVNVSMNQVLMRSLNTSLAAVLPVLSLLILGAEIMGAVSLREFSLALLVGLITGSYSSIFVAAPLLGMLKERSPKFRTIKTPHATGAALERLVLGASPAGKREMVRTRVRGDATLAAAAEAIMPAGPKPVLTHPPRPRKKKRRGT